jgi:hypothetical protein
MRARNFGQSKNGVEKVSPKKWPQKGWGRKSVVSLVSGLTLGYFVP